MMAGTILLVIYIALGFSISTNIFPKQPIHIKAWLGGIIGILGMMWLVVPFSFIFGFTYTSHFAAVFTMIAISAAIYVINRKKELVDKPQNNGAEYAFYIVTAVISVMIIYLLNGHVLLQKADGGLYGGQSTFGDLSLHLGIITSIAEQGVFPPEYSIFPGQMLSYPFLVNSLSSSLYLFGTPLRWAVLIPSYVLTVLLVAGFFILCFEILKRRFPAVLSCIFFFLNGGFGFIYFMDGLKKDPSNLTRMFSAWYNTPTNYNDHFIRWSNTICDMIIPQRATLAGWAFIIPAIWLLHIAIRDSERKYFVYAGIAAGLLPMIQTHSYLALGLVAITWFFVYLFQTENKKRYILNWIYFGVAAAILSLPQLFFWTFRQASGDAFTRWQWGWQANEGDNWIWFWVKNVGVVIVLLIPALLTAGKKLLSVYSGAITLFIAANFILFQPNSYDNNKLFYIWYLFTAIIVSSFIYNLFNDMKTRRVKWSVISIIMIFAVFSGVLTFGREAKSNGEVLLYDRHAVAASEYIRQNTPKDALFISSDQHLNPVAALSGRNILSGTSIYLFFHGIDKSERDAVIFRMYTEPDAFEMLAEENGVDYVYYSNYEKGRFKAEPTYFMDNYPTVFQQGDVYIFAVSERAREFGDKDER